MIQTMKQMSPKNHLILLPYKQYSTKGALLLKCNNFFSIHKLLNTARHRFFTYNSLFKLYCTESLLV